MRVVTNLIQIKVGTGGKIRSLMQFIP